MTVTTRNSEEKSQKRGTEKKKTGTEKYGTKKSRHGETRSGERELYEFVAKARAYRRRSRSGSLLWVLRPSPTKVVGKESATRVGRFRRPLAAEKAALLEADRVSRN